MDRDYVPHCGLRKSMTRTYANEYRDLRDCLPSGIERHLRSAFGRYWYLVASRERNCSRHDFIAMNLVRELKERISEYAHARVVR